MQKIWLGVFLVLCTVISAGGVKGQITLNITDSVVHYSPGAGEMDMELVISSHEYIDPLSELSVYIDDTLEDMIIIANFATGGHSFRENPFSYELVSTGTREWNEYQRVNFSYLFSASGLCCTNQTEIDQGLCDCVVSGTCEPVGPEEYPCEWSITEQWEHNSYVSGADGLKFIIQSGISGPVSRDESTTVWSADITSSDAAVAGTMRDACGSPWEGDQSKYMGLYVDHNGWVYVTKHRDDFTYLPGSEADYQVHIGVPCDEDSMVPGFTAYGGPTLFPSGGVYKDGVIISQPGRVVLNGTTGYVRINGFELTDSNYDFAFLPPNGNLFCAYTPVKTAMESGWEVTSEVANVSARYDNPYAQFFSESVIESLLKIPNCPVGTFECVRTRETVSARETYDGNDAVSVTYQYGSLTVYGNVSEQVYDDVFSERMDLNYSLPPEKDAHYIRVSLSAGGETYEKTQEFFVCDDDDDDSFCSETVDCNDTDPDIYQGAPELCNGLDDNCNGDVDETFWGLGKIGQGCRNWPGSRCVGTLVCSNDGSNVTCKPNDGYYYPGQLKEICGNGKDDDCDGEIDETYDFETGEEACVEEDEWCQAGDTRPCRNKGICITDPGTRTCVDGEWGECIGGNPETEVCNNRDDDCDGIIDNINGEVTEIKTRCWCTATEGEKKTPKSGETCNDIDDDCDGRIDEGVTDCCTAGQTRFCGTDEGVCELGIQRCDGGLWGACEGGVEPNPDGDVCCNKLDDDCNSLVDEYCSKEVCDKAAQIIFVYWLIIGFGAIMVIASLVLYRFRGRIFRSTGATAGTVPEGGLQGIVFKLKKIVREIIERIKRLLGRGKQPQPQQRQPQQQRRDYRGYGGYPRRDSY